LPASAPGWATVAIRKICRCLLCGGHPARSARALRPQTSAVTGVRHRQLPHRLAVTRASGEGG
jgi:hypothetical protein